MIKTSTAKVLYNKLMDPMMYMLAIKIVFVLFHFRYFVSFLWDDQTNVVKLAEEAR